MSALILLAYAAGMLAVGWHLRAAGGSQVESYLAGRSLGPGLIASSIAATSIGGSATVVLARFVHERGLAGIWLDLPLAVALLLLGAFIAPRVRQTGCLSLPDVAGRLYDERFRKAVAVLSVAAAVAWFGLLVRAAAPFVVMLTSVPETVASLVLAAVFIAYTALGGQRAVAWTDGIQLALIGILGLAVPAVAILSRTDFLQGIAPQKLAFPTSESTDGLAIAGWVALIGPPGLVGGDIWSKILSARDARAAKTGALLAGAFKLAGTLCVAIIGLGAHLLLPHANSGEDILPQVIATVLPHHLTSLAAIAFLATMMSSADSVLLTGTTMLDVDLLPHPRSARCESRRVRALPILIGGLGAGIGYGASSLVHLMKWAYTIFAAGAPLPILFGLQSRIPIPPWSATLSLATGGSVAIAAKALALTRPEPVLVGLLASLLCLVLGAASNSAASGLR